MRRIALTFALVGALALGACGGEASPKPAPLTKTPSPSVTAPTLGAEAQGASRVAATAVIRYFFTSFAYAGATGDTTGLSKVSSSECTGCTDLIRTIEKTLESGGSFAGDGYTVQSVDFSAKSTASVLVASVPLKIAAQRYTESRGASPTTYPPSTATWTVTVRLVSGDWKIVGVLR